MIALMFISPLGPHWSTVAAKGSNKEGYFQLYPLQITHPIVYSNISRLNIFKSNTGAICT